MYAAIIGAGMAGLTVANSLQAAGYRVRVFDKGRGPGGRMSTRRVTLDDLTVRFDHGAQYMLPKTPAFQAQLERWVDAGVAGLWRGRVVSIDAAGQVTDQSDKPRFVGKPGMNDIIRHLASDPSVEWGRRVQTVDKGDTLSLRFEDGSVEAGFHLVIVAVPAEQVSDIVSDLAPDFAAAAKGVQSSPCWTVMAAFENETGIDWDAASMTGSPIGWAARNSSKPGRTETETWVLQASAEWSQTHLEDERDEVTEALLSAFAEYDLLPRPLYATAHRWRYSQVKSVPSAPFYFDSKRGVGVCGDWCSGPNVEDAWQSGMALGERLLQRD